MLNIDNPHTTFRGRGQSVNFTNWNVKGLNHPIKRTKVLAHLKNLKTDIAFLTETHIRSSDRVSLRRGWVGQEFHSNFTSKARGAGILISKSVLFVATETISDPNGRFLIVVGKLYCRPVILACVYAPNWDDSGFMNNFLSRIPYLDTHQLILAGDCNCVINPVLDRSSNRPISNSKTAECLEKFLQSYGMSDPWRFLYPTRKEYSFFSPVHHTYSRIDYFFIHRSFLPLIHKCNYNSIVISDHAPVTLSLIFPNQRANRFRWRLNPLLLSEESFVAHVNIHIDIFLETNVNETTSPSLLWEALKAYLRGQIISYNASVRTARLARRDDLSELIAAVDKIYATAPTPELLKQRTMYQAEFDMLSTGQAERALLKNRHRSYEHGEKPGRALAYSLRQISTTHVIEQIESETGLVSDPSDINRQFSEFYSKLYSSQEPSDPNVMRTFFEGLDLPTVDENIRKSLDRPFSLDEINDAITCMQSGKCPGPDGFPTEFYKKFSPKLSPLLKNVFDDSFRSQCLPPTLRQASISLLLKKGKDPLNCSSYRPISLLNVDVKILAKVLALRLESVLPSLVSCDQTGFIKNRQLFFNIRRVFNILYTPSSAQVPEVLLSLDAAAAFDRVSWEYLFYVLQHFGFGNTFISWVKLLYTSPTASVRTNDTYSPYFPLQRGTRQGCPLSPLLFALVMEPLAATIRRQTDIKGIYRAHREHKISLYADDVLLFISDPTTSIPHILNTLSVFGSFSGYKLNIDKSELLPINAAARKISFHSLPFKVSNEGLKYLGVYVTKFFSQLIKANFNPLLQRTQQDLNRWSTLPLSLAGRISVIKMNILPKFLFLFQCIPCFLTKSFFTKIDSVISSFIWNNKRPRIRKLFLQRPKMTGGMALPNFQIYYWAANIRCLLYWFLDPSSMDSPGWLHIESHSCSPVSLSALLCSSIPLHSPQDCQNPVLLQSLKIWSQFRKHYGLVSLSVYAPVTSNHLFPASLLDHTFYQWFQNGVLNIKSLYENDTFMSFDQVRETFHLSPNNFFRYLQVRHFVRSHFTQFPSIPVSSSLDAILEVQPALRGTISRLYAKIFDLEACSLMIVKENWENDLGVNITEQQWSDILRRIHSTSICARHGLIQFKIVHRLHMSKVKLSKIYPEVDPICNRCKQVPATLFHTFWSCSSLTSFWSSIFEAYSSISGVTIDPCPFIGLFGVPSEALSLQNPLLNCIAYSSLLARRLILLNWKNDKPPSFGRWICDVIFFLKVEKIRYTLNGSTNNFYVIWQPFISYVEQLTMHLDNV